MRREQPCEKSAAAKSRRAPFPRLFGTGPRPARYSARAGFSLLEVASSVLVTLALTTVAVEMLARQGRQRREAERHALALEEAANLMERLTLERDLPATPQPKPLELSAAAKARLPNARATVSVVDDSGQPLRQATIEVVWQSAAGPPARPVRLAAWFPRGGSP